MSSHNRHAAETSTQHSRGGMFLGRYAGSLGGLALAHLLAQQEGSARAATASGAVQAPHGPAKAKNVICLFQHGGPSQMDLFDPKPALHEVSRQAVSRRRIWKCTSPSRRATCWPRRSSSPRPAQCGMELCELLPHTARVADDLTLVRSMNTESVDHESALRLIHTGKFLAGMPTWGSWVTYALGTENQNLPAYVVLVRPGRFAGRRHANWSAGWLPAVYQGTPFRAGKSPVLNLQTPEGVPPAARRNQLALSRAAQPGAPRAASGKQRTGGAAGELRNGRADANRGARRAGHFRRNGRNARAVWSG